MKNTTTLCAADGAFLPFTQTVLGISTNCPVLGDTMPPKPRIEIPLQAKHYLKKTHTHTHTFHNFISSPQHVSPIHAKGLAIGSAGVAFASSAPCKFMKSQKETE